MSKTHEMSRVRPAGSVPPTRIEVGDGTSMQVLIGRHEAPNFCLRRFVIEPGGSMPLHTNEVEHEQYVLGGRAQVRIGESKYDVAAGDAVYIPAGVEHDYRNQGNEPFEFICVVPNRDDRIVVSGC